LEYVLKDLMEWNEAIESKAKELGLNFYPQEFEIIGFNEMLGYEAYVGMPSRYPHWSFGKSYEKNKTLYSFDLTGLPYEMVINSLLSILNERKYSSLTNTNYGTCIWS
jgi:stage V sporulation protein R